MDKEKGENGWGNWKEHVLSELNNNSVDHNEIKKILTKIQIDVATLKVKSGVWGFTAGLIPVLIALSIIIIKGL